MNAFADNARARKVRRLVRVIDDAAKTRGWWPDGLDAAAVADGLEAVGSGALWLEALRVAGLGSASDATRAQVVGVYRSRARGKAQLPRPLGINRLFQPMRAKPKPAKYVGCACGRPMCTSPSCGEMMRRQEAQRALREDGQ